MSLLQLASTYLHLSIIKWVQKPPCEVAPRPSNLFQIPNQNINRNGLLLNFPIELERLIASNEPIAQLIGLYNCFTIRKIRALAPIDHCLPVSSIDHHLVMILCH